MKPPCVLSPRPVDAGAVVDADDEHGLVLLLELIGDAVASAVRAVVKFSLEGFADLGRVLRQNRVDELQDRPRRSGAGSSPGPAAPGWPT